MCGRENDDDYDDDDDDDVDSTEEYLERFQ